MISLEQRLTDIEERLCRIEERLELAGMSKLQPLDLGISLEDIQALQEQIDNQSETSGTVIDFPTDRVDRTRS